MKTKTKFLLFAAIAIFASSCYPGGAKYVDELDTSISKYNPEYAWDAIGGKTYTMPEEIRHIKDGDDVEDPDRKYDDDIIVQVNKNMQRLGFVLVDGSNQDEVDIVVALTLIEQNNRGASWVPGGGWWGGWYPGWGPGWGWGGYYPWYPVYYNYKTGSTLIHMGDFKNREVIDGKEIVPPIYEGAVDGLIQGSSQYIGNRIERGIDELYNQAPF